MQLGCKQREHTCWRWVKHREEYKIARLINWLSHCSFRQLNTSLGCPFHFHYCRWIKNIRLFQIYLKWFCVCMRKMSTQKNPNLKQFMFSSHTRVSTELKGVMARSVGKIQFYVHTERNLHTGKLTVTCTTARGQMGYRLVHMDMKD